MADAIVKVVNNRPVVQVAGVPTSLLAEAQQAAQMAQQYAERTGAGLATKAVATKADLASVPAPALRDSVLVTSDPAGDVANGNGVYSWNGSGWVWITPRVDPGIQTQIDDIRDSMDVSKTYLRPAGSSLKSGNRAPSNTRVIAESITRDGVLKKLRIYWAGGQAGGEVRFRIFERVSGSGPLSVGDQLVKSGEDIVLSLGLSGWQTFSVNRAVRAGQFFGWYATPESGIPNLSPVSGQVDAVGFASVAGDYSALTIASISSPTTYLVGMDVVSRVVTAEALDETRQKVNNLEESGPFYTEIESLPRPSPGRQGVVESVGPVWSDGAAWLRVADNRPVDTPWNRIAALAASDGWEAVYDPGNAWHRDQTGGNVTRLYDARGIMPDFAAVGVGPTLSEMGGLTTLSMGAGSATTLRTAAFASQLNGPYTVMFAARASDPAINQVAVDGIKFEQRVAALLTGGNYRMLTSGAEQGAVPADGAAHIWTMSVDASGDRLRIDHNTVVSAPPTAPRALTGLTLGDRYAADGRYFRGQLGPLLVYRGNLPDDARIRMTKLLMELAEIDLPPLSITSPSSISMDENGVYFDKDPDTKRNPASVTKMLSLLTAWEYIEDPDAVVTVISEDIIHNIDNSPMLQSGDQITIRNLMYMAMLPSSNNAVTAIARIAGEAMPGADAPLVKFVGAMAVKAADLGMSGSSWPTPSGLGRVSASARDCAKLALAYAAVPELADIGATMSRNIEITGANARSFAITHTAAAANLPNLVCAKTGTGDSKFTLAAVCLVGGKPCAFVALANATVAGRNADVLRMAERRIWESA